MTGQTLEARVPIQDTDVQTDTRPVCHSSISALQTILPRQSKGELGKRMFLQKKQATPVYTLASLYWNIFPIELIGFHAVVFTVQKPVKQACCTQKSSMSCTLSSYYNLHTCGFARWWCLRNQTSVVPSVTWTLKRPDHSSYPDQDNLNFLTNKIILDPI